MFMGRYLRRCFLRHRTSFPFVFTLTVIALMLLLLETNFSIRKHIKFHNSKFTKHEYARRVSAAPKTTTTTKITHKQREVTTTTVRQDLIVHAQTTTKSISGKLRPQIDKLHEKHDHAESNNNEDDHQKSFDDFDQSIKFKSIKHGLYHNTLKPGSFFTRWRNKSVHLCSDHGGKFVAYDNEFALLHDVIIDRVYANGRDGGEKIEEVINQDESVEYYTFEPGFMQIPCTEIRKNYTFNKQNHINDWLTAVQSYTGGSNDVKHSYTPFTVAITRYEYVNLYHTMTDFYNAFLVMEFFHKKQEEINILVIDGHPKGSLDSVWNVLFNSTFRISQLPDKTKFTELVWGMQGYNSPMLDHSAKSIPFPEPFREFFLRSFNIEDDHTLDCDHVRIMFIWRHNYIAHPRNPQGVVGRKIANENELVLFLQRNLPSGYIVYGKQIDQLKMRSQLEHIKQADILIGMHGAGLTHTMFLPKHAGLIELVPNYWSAANEHFEAIAKWRNLHYEKWVNEDMKNEMSDKNTRIPPDVLNVMVRRMVQDICPGSKTINNFYMQQKMTKS